MAIVSMTGFAEAQGSREGARWRWEAKSVNGRGLDLRLRLPQGFESIEAAARMLAGDRFKRGNMQASLTFEAAASVRGLRIDAAALASAVKIAKEVAPRPALRPASIDGLLALKGVIVQDESLGNGRARMCRPRCRHSRKPGRRLRRSGAGARRRGRQIGLVLDAQIAEVARLTETAAAPPPRSTGSGSRLSLRPRLPPKPSASHPPVAEHR